MKAILVFLFVSLAFAEYVDLVHVRGTYGRAIEEMRLLGYDVLDIVEDQHAILVRGKQPLTTQQNSMLTSLGVEHHRTQYGINQLSNFEPAPFQYMKVLLWRPLSKETEEKWHHNVELRVVKRFDTEPSVVVTTASGSSSQSREHAFEYLSTQTTVVRNLEPWAPARLFDATANYVLQSYQLAPCNISSPFVGCTAFWDAGFDGTGQLLGVGDTGVDMRQCFFNDASCTPSSEGAKPPSCGGTYLQEPCGGCVGYCTFSDSVSCVPAPTTHRSVKAFYAVDNDYTDHTDQHGTAVCGVAVGSPDPTSAPPAVATQNRGAAPGARLAFMDLSPAGDSFLNVPAPMDTEYFPWFKNNGAFISTQSWGSMSGVGYSSDTQAIDRFVWNNPTFLPIFASGNDGAPGFLGVFLLLSAEAASKNALTVGATMTELSQVLMFPDFSAEFGVDLSSNATLWSARALAGFSSTGPSLDRRIKPDVVAPGLLTITALQGSPRSNTASANCAFPGAVAGWTGTSFSAPLIAGYAVLLRQWLLSGQYRGIAFASPSAALLKALLMTSGRPLLAINFYEQGQKKDASQIDTDVNLEPYGSQWAWGQGLPLVDPLVASNGTNTIVVDSLSLAEMTAQGTPAAAFTSDGDEMALCVQSLLPAFSETTLSVMMTYTDFPGSVPTTTAHGRVSRLVNDLDVFTVDDLCAIGFANHLTGLDRLNNAERVQLALGNALNIPLSIWHLVITRPARLTVTPQDYALALTHLSDNIPGMHLNALAVTLSLTDNTTSLPGAHPCSQMYAMCKSTIDSLRVSAVPLPTPSPRPSVPVASNGASTTEEMLSVCLTVVLTMVVYVAGLQYID